MSKKQSETKKNAEIAALIREGGLRARAEAEMRRKAEKPFSTHKEIGGTGGLEPTRYGDWERKGVISDF